MAKSIDGACLSDPNFAVICSFLDRYGEILGLPEVSCINLQNWVEDSKHVSKILADIHVRLLRRIRTNVTVDRWEKVLVKYCYTYSEVDAWEVERFGYKHSKLSTKLRVLKNLLESQFDYNSKFKDKINELSPEEMRFLPLGRDRNGLAYYYMLDKDVNLRVYRECQDDIDAESWEVVCKDRSELFNLIRSLQSEVSINNKREKEESPDTAEENRNCKVKNTEEKVLEDICRDEKPLIKDIKVEPPDKDDTREDAGTSTEVKNGPLAIKTDKNDTEDAGTSTEGKNGSLAIKTDKNDTEDARTSTEVKNGSLVIKTDKNDTDSEGGVSKEELKEKQEVISNRVHKKKQKVKKVFNLEMEHEKEHNKFQDKSGHERLKYETSSLLGKEKSVQDLDNELESDINGRDSGRRRKWKDSEVIPSKNTDKGKEKQSSDVDHQEHERTLNSKQLNFNVDSEVRCLSGKGNGRNMEKKNSVNPNFIQKKENLNESEKTLPIKLTDECFETECKISGKELELKHKNRSVKSTKGQIEAENKELSKIQYHPDQNKKSEENNDFVSSDMKNKTGEKNDSLSTDSKDEKAFSKCKEDLIKGSNQNDTLASHTALPYHENKESNQLNEANKDNKNILNSLSFDEGKGECDFQKICKEGDGDQKITGKIDSDEADKTDKIESRDLEIKTDKDVVLEIKIRMDKENKIQSECNKDEVSPNYLELKKDDLERSVWKGESASLISTGVESHLFQGSVAIDTKASDSLDQSKVLNAEQSSQNLDNYAGLICQKSETEKNYLESKCREKAEEGFSSDKKQKFKKRKVSIDDRQSKISESLQDEKKDCMEDQQDRVKGSSNSTCIKCEENEGSRAVEANSMKNMSEDSVPNSRRLSKNRDEAFSRTYDVSKETNKKVNDIETVEKENFGTNAQNTEDIQTASKGKNGRMECIETNTGIEHDEVSACKEKIQEQSTDIKIKIIGDMEEQSKELVSGKSIQNNERNKSIDEGSKYSATSAAVVRRKNMRTRSKAKGTKQDQDTDITSVNKSISSHGHEQELSTVLKGSKSETDETCKSKNKQVQKESVDKTAHFKIATETEKEQNKAKLDETEKAVKKRGKMKNANKEKEVEINSQEETYDKKIHEQKTEKENNERENISVSTERGKGCSPRRHISGASGSRKRQNWVDESADDSPLEPVSKKAKGRNHVTSRGRGRKAQQQVASSSGNSSSTSSDDDIPLSSLSKCGRGRGAMRGRGTPIRGRGGSKQVLDVPTRKSSRPVKKKRFDSDEDSDSQTPVAKSKTVSQKKEDEDQQKEEESVEETGCRRSARVRSLRARKKEKAPSPELDLVDDLDDSSYIAEESDDDDYVLAKRRGKRKTKCKVQEDLIPKGRNAQRQEALSKGKKKEEKDDTPCCKCLKSQHPEWILLCDKCDAGYHTACLRPPLMIIPDGEWFCPPCEHEFLIKKLQENLDTLDSMLRKHDRLVKRRERLAFVGISLDNILKEETKENIEPEEEEEDEEEVECETDLKKSSAKFKFSGRSCRQHRNISYKFEEFDEMINTAIEDDMREPRPPKPPRLPKPPGISRGKDMANIFGEEHEDLEEKAQAISRKRKSKLTELDEEDFDDDSEEYEASEDADSEATCEKDWESEEVSDFSEEEFCPPRYATRKSNRRRKAWTRYDVDDDDDCDSLEERSRRRSNRSSARRRKTRHDILSDEEEMSTDGETEDPSDYWSSSQESSRMKKSLKDKTLGKTKGKSKKKKRKIMSSENENEEESDNECSKKKKKDKKSLRERDDDDDSDYSESDYEERTYRRVSRRNINKRVNYRIMLGSESSSNSSKSANEKTESEDEEIEKINTTKSKKKNVIESDSDGTDDYYEEEKKTKKEMNSAEEGESVSEVLDTGSAVEEKEEKQNDPDAEDGGETIHASDKREDLEKKEKNQEENVSEVTIPKLGEIPREELKSAEIISPEQTKNSQNKQDSIVEEEKETGEIVEIEKEKEKENMSKKSPQESSNNLGQSINSGNENAKVIDKKDDRIFSSKKSEAPVGVVKPEVRQGVIVENHQGVESCTPGPIPGQAYPLNYRMGSPNQGMRDPNMASPPIGSPPRHIKGQEQGFRHVSPSYSQNKGSMGGYLQPGFQTYHPQQQGPYTLSHSGPFPHGDPSRFYPQSSQCSIQQAPYSPSTGQPYMSHPNVGPHCPYPEPYGPSMSNQGHHSSPSNYQGHSQGHYGPQGPLGPSYGGYPQGPHGSTHHPQGFHSPPSQGHYQGPHPQGPYPLSQPQNPYHGSATGPYPYQHGNSKVLPQSQGPYPHAQSHSAPQHMSVMRPQMGPQGVSSPNFPPQEKSFMQSSITDQVKAPTSKGTPEKGSGERPTSKSAKGKNKKGEKKTLSSIQPLEVMRTPKRSGFMMDNILKPISTPEQGPFHTPTSQPEEDMDEIEDIVNYVANDEYFKEH